MDDRQKCCQFALKTKLAGNPRQFFILLLDRFMDGNRRRWLVQ
jgi:hypothetical protein